MKMPSKKLTSWFLAGLVLFFAVSSSATHVGFGASYQTSFSPRSASFNHLFSFFNSSSRRFAANRLVEPSDLQLQAVLPASDRVLVVPQLGPKIQKTEPAAVSCDGSLNLPLRI